MFRHFLNVAIISFAILGASSCQIEREFEKGFEFGVYNLSGGNLTDVATTFPPDGNAHGTWRMGVLSASAIATISTIPGAVPDKAEVTWTDAANVVHKERVQIRPLPPPTATSYNGTDREIYFVIQPDNTVKIVYHDPRFTG